MGLGGPALCRRSLEASGLRGHRRRATACHHSAAGRARRRLDAIRLPAEAVHPERPLQADQRALHARQKQERCDQSQGQPDHRVHPGCRGICALQPQNSADNNVADHNDGEIRGRIIGALVVEILAAGRALIRNLQEAAKQPALAAFGTTQAKPAQHRAPGIARCTDLFGISGHIQGHGALRLDGTTRRQVTPQHRVSAVCVENDKCARWRLLLRLPGLLDDARHSARPQPPDGWSRLQGRQRPATLSNPPQCRPCPGSA